MTLQAAYNATYQEKDNMNYDRQNGDAGGFVGGMLDKGVGWVAGVMGELQQAGNSLINANGQAAMSGDAVFNPRLGMQFGGHPLRTHNFTWKLTPKSQDEQQAIQDIVMALKLASTGRASTLATNRNVPLSKLMQDSKKRVQGETVDMESLNTVGESASSLSIPMTARLRFLATNESDELVENPHLFKISDCFITNVDVNYTPTGQWNAYRDSGPIETSLTIGLKEITAMTQADIIWGA
jgi:hypothetical protein